jgi:hypothetical protein
MIDRKTARHAGWTLSLCLFSAAAQAEPADSQFARDFAGAWSNEAWDAIALAIHPVELDRVRKRVLEALEAESKDGGKDIRTRLFGAAVSIEEIRRMTPHAVMTLLVKRFLTAPRAMKKTKLIGKVKESDELQHYVVRGWDDEKGKGASSVVLVSLIPYGKEWAAAVPAEIEEKVLAAIAGAAVGARDIGDGRIAALDPGIIKLLERAIAALKEARCSEYYNDIMSPNFRKATASAAVKTLITQCEKNAAMRDKTRLTLEIARNLKPRYEYNDTRAVFDMRGQGLPFERFVVEMIDRKWYVAE